MRLENCYLLLLRFLENLLNFAFKWYLLHFKVTNMAK